MHASMPPPPEEVQEAEAEAEGVEEAEAEEEAEVELTRCGTVCSSVAFLFEPKLRTKTSLRGGGWPLVITTMREEEEVQWR